MSNAKFWLSLVGILFLASALSSCGFVRARDVAAEATWRPFGGAWSEDGGVIYNRSDERGAKLISSSITQSDAQVTADVRPLGRGGEAGIMLRVRNADTGIDQYDGYYAGIRMTDNALVIGRSHHDWMEAAPVRLKGSLASDRWYHLRVVVVGCRIAAEVTDPVTLQGVATVALDQACIPGAGAVGLRSVDGGASWRSIRVLSTSPSDIDALAAKAHSLTSIRYPEREDDYTRMREVFNDGRPPARLGTPVESDILWNLDNTSSKVRDIANLNSTLSDGVSARIRGTVVFTDPIYIQDDSGSILLAPKTPISLNIGDHVDAEGQFNEVDGARTLQANNVRVLWDRSPLSPRTTSATEIASGRDEGRLVSLTARLIRQAKDPVTGRSILEMADGPESFEVVLPSDFTQLHFTLWDQGSTLQVTGVCAPVAKENTAKWTFALLPRNISEIQIVAAPQWNEGIRLWILSSLVILLITSLAFGYNVMDRAARDRVLKQREQLALDLHDTLAQSFAGIGFQLQGLRKHLRSSHRDESRTAETVDLICNLAMTTHQEASARIRNLHPPADDDMDVLDILQQCISALIEDNQSLNVTFERVGTSRYLSPEIRDALLRIGQEAFANVLRHSDAGNVSIILFQEFGFVRLIVRDDGVGFDPELPNSRQGVTGMRARAVLWMRLIEKLV